MELLEEVFKLEPKSGEAEYYLARAYHLNYKFDDAITRIDALKKNKKIFNSRKTEIMRLREMCLNAKQLIEKATEVTIKNIGEPLNSGGSEYVPVITSDESVIIFTYKGARGTGGKMDKYGNPDPNGDYFEDIFISYKLGDKWLLPESIGENINSPGHDAAIALSADGQKLFVYKDTEESSGDIFMSYLEGDIWGYPIALNENINSKHWEGSASLSPDEKTLYFVSNRPGGLGGRDIYISKRQEDGTWGKSESAGVPINTIYNDDGPFIHPDGKTLYYSSEGYNSIGGYDIFKTVWQSDGKWSQPENLGFPINTPDDDKYYVEAANGQRAYYSTGKVGGLGFMDIYVIHWGIKEKVPAVALIKGIVTVDEQPAKSSIVVHDLMTTEIQGTYNSNSATGKYLVNLPAGKNYKINYSVEGFETQVKDVILADKDTFTEITIDIRLFTPGYVPGPKTKVDGKLYYSDDTSRAGKNLTLTIAGQDNIQMGKTVTNDLGRFTFAQLPAVQKYFITIDETDPDFQAKQFPAIEGIITVNDTPRAGINVNSAITDEKGFFKLKLFSYDTLPMDFNKLESMNFNDPALYQELVKKFGSVSAPGLFFQVQVAAYYDPSKFNPSHLKEVGELKVQKLNDGITRFAVGDYKTLNEAEMTRQRLVTKGINDAFVTVYYNGERKIWAEVVRNNFYQNK